MSSSSRTSETSAASSRPQTIARPASRPIPAGVGVYVHIPFCSVKCDYCDFACYAGREREMTAYVAALELEIASYPPLEAATLYLGGGTPSLLPPDLLERVLGAVRARYRMPPDAEITMEINPGTGSRELWQTARATGVNRVSVGAQVFDDRGLTALGRDHAVSDVYRTVGELREAGFNDLSLDLMFGLPGQDVRAWRATLERALALAPEHFSIYGLQIEDRTAFGVRFARGQLTLPGEDAEREMLDVLVDTMAAGGYRRYEISSWCRPGFESAHNRIYWLTRPYIGLGTGAHSYFNGRRYAHGRSIDGYVRSPLPEFPAEPQPVQEAMEEAVFMGLRLVEEGVSRQEFRQRFGRDWRDVFGSAILAMTGLGLLEETPECMRLTPAALPVANGVFAEFLL